LEKVNPLGTVPILKDKTTDAYIVDSDTISDYLETKFADTERKKLGTLAECFQPGHNIWTAFWNFLSTESTDKEKEALEAELKQINDAVGDSQPFIGGQSPSAWDMALAPRLYLARVGCKELKNWDFCNDFPNVMSYLHRWTGRSSWRNTASWDDESLIADLKAKLAKESGK
jgi:glutathione S-transferase